MARQKYSSRQAETKASIENVPINSSNNSSNQTDQAIKQIKQSKRSSKQADQANKQIKQSNRSSKQTDRTNKQIKQASRSSKQTKSPRKAFTLLLANRPDKWKSNEQAETKRASNTVPENRTEPTKSISGSDSCSFARRFVQRGFPA